VYFNTEEECRMLVLLWERGDCEQNCVKNSQESEILGQMIFTNPKNLKKQISGCRIPNEFEFGRQMDQSVVAAR